MFNIFFRERREKMAQKKSKKITYKEFMKQLDAARSRMGKSWYKMLETEFINKVNKARVHRIH